MGLDESQFETLAGETLDRLMERIDRTVGQNHDVDLEQGILTIDLEGLGTYVINKHAPNKQIWLSSPFSGAAHFSYIDGEGWISPRGGDRLEDVLSAELLRVLGYELTLD